jgi:hypothetical protein
MIGFILSNYNKGALLLAHLDILAFFPRPVGVVVVDMGRQVPEGEGYHLRRIPDSGFQIGPLLALVEGLREAKRHGLENVCYRPADDWVFNHAWVEDNFRHMPAIKFQATNWFTTGTHEDFALNESYYHVDTFLATVEPFLEWALFHERDLAVERKLARWVWASIKPNEYRALPGRDRTPPIGYPDGEMHLWFNHNHQQVPAGWQEVRDPDNDRFFNQQWQLVGNHDAGERLERYLRLRPQIGYARELEGRRHFGAWLGPARPADSAKESKMNVSIRFHHGLGDCTNFAHTLPLYTERGYRVEVACSPDKAPLFRAAGAAITDGCAAAHHGFPHPPVADFNRLDDPWNSNKTAFSISQYPMPIIGRDFERWPDLCRVHLTLADQLTPEIRQRVDDAIAPMQRPLILLHTQGNTSPDSKNLAADQTIALYERLLDQTDGTLILLDWDMRVPRLLTYRCRHLGAELWPMNAVELWYLMEQSQLLIGIDSGPLHFARFSKIPALGLWVRHYVSHFALPRENTLHLVPGFHRRGDKYRRHAFNTVATAEDTLTAKIIARHALRFLSPPRYLPVEHHGRDVQLQHFVDLTHGEGGPHTNYVDRHRSFDQALLFLKGIDNPTVVETGCIRQEEDWGGAGFSTYLWSHFLNYHGGMLHSVDFNGPFCQFAASWTEPFQGHRKIYTRYSHDFLKEWSEPIDLLYCDSADIGTEGYMETCLGEVQLAQRNLGERSRILIDDTFFFDRAWSGKGTAAVPWLLENGWRVVYSGFQTLLERKGPGAR